jgi:D-lactate dehydrogenase (cytochrome)
MTRIADLKVRATWEPIADPKVRATWEFSRGRASARPFVCTICTMVTEVIDDLRALLGDRLSTSDAVREHHSHGESWHAPGLPDAVAFPTSTDEVAAIVRACAATKTPIVPFGMGSSLEAHVNAIRGGVSIDLTRMTRVVRLSAEDLDVTVEAGLTHRKLNDQLKNTGLMFPVDPGADATIGGMTATRASGTTAVRYGTMRENVLALKLVLPNGRVIETGSRARKSSSGYDLTRLFVGSEGTLGVITEVTLRLYGRPEAVSAAVCPFASMEGAANTVITTIQLGIPVARIEIIDELQLDLVNRYSKTSYPLAPTLFFEFHGTSEAAVAEHAKMVDEIAREHGATGFQWASTLEDRATLWQARHNVLYATIASRPAAKPWTTDVCVPISRLAECILETQADLRAANIAGPLVGHAGDGNFHLIFERVRVRGCRSRQPSSHRTRAAPWRHVHRRTWRRDRKTEILAARARRIARRDAIDQARARSG